MLWILFHAIVVVALALDLGVFHRRAHAVGGREAALWSAVWVALGLGFGVVVFVQRGTEAGTEYLTAYLIEKALSVDNLFVFVLVFAYFRVPAEHQHRVLFWGVLGAIVLRGALIVTGIAVVSVFEPILYLFGAILVWSGIKMLRADDDGIEPDKNPVLRWARKVLPVTPEPRGSALWVREPGEGGRLRTMATPLFIVLICVELTDLLFAVDSIPAVFAVTDDSMVAYTSNVFAVLGLRSLYFLLAIVVSKLRYLKFGLSAILVFIGVKMLLKDVFHVEPSISLAVVGAVLTVATVASLLVLRRAEGDLSSVSRPERRERSDEE
ncbi:MAG TPA: TerC family protein [Sandaracinaceae bacterium]